MGKLRVIIFAAIAAVVGACSSGDGSIVSGPPADGPGGDPAADIASLILLTSSPQMPSDGSGSVTITALVRDSNNNVVENVGVVLSADSGSLTMNDTVTDASGTVSGTLSTAGDPTNRTITITGTAGANDSQDTVSVSVIGTSLIIDGPTTLGDLDQREYTVLLTDAGDTGISNEQVEITSSAGNPISATPVTTDSLGRASFELTANVAGTDTLTATALGIEATLDVEISGDSFAFSSPDAGTEIDLGVSVPVTVVLERDGGFVAGEDITFASTRGTLSSAMETTDANGTATVDIESTNSGPAVVTATNAEGTSTQLNIEFVATTPAALELQADPFTVAANDQSAITAIVRDAAGNLVKNQQVVFELTDVTGGSLSVAQATTSTLGRARTFYNASDTTSAVDGVRIDATVAGTAVTDFVNLTVAQREVFISIGTGNEIEEPNTAQYLKEWIVQVTDAQGNGVDGVNVSVSVLSERYWDGIRDFIDPPGTWATRRGIEAEPFDGCIDEDINNRNGVLDPGEDQNTNGKIEAGNIATAVAQDGGGSTVTTDVNGFALIDVYWPQEYAYWLEVTLEARTAVQGTEFSETTTFMLSGSADDFNSQDTAPPGETSPFGTDGDCATPPPPDGP